MPFRFLMALIAILFFAGSAFAAKNLNTSRSNIYRAGTPKVTAGPVARSTTVKSSKSNSSDRMGGGGGGMGAAGMSRMGGGGGKGGMR